MFRLGPARTDNFSCSPGWRTLLYATARAQATLLLPQLKSYNLTHSRGNGTVAGDNRMHMFQHVRAHWQTTCSKVHKHCVLRHKAMSIVEDVEKLTWEVARRPSL